MNLLTLGLVGALAINMSVYPKTMIVTDINDKKDIVTVMDFNGVNYQFVGVEDWYYGDVCAAIMSDNGTPNNIYDDSIIYTNYCGWIDGNWGYGSHKITMHPPYDDEK